MRSIACCWLLIFAISSAAGTSQVGPASPPAPIPDLNLPVQRLITLAPHLAELVYAIGAEDQLVGTVAYSDFPEAVKTKPVIGDAFHLDFESIVKLQPELILAWDSGSPAQAIQQLEKLGFTVWSVTTRTPQDIAKLTRQLGQLTGRQQRANQLAEQATKRLSRLAKRYAAMPQRRYFLQVADQPLYTVTQNHIISSALSLCQGENIFAELNSVAPSIDAEAVIQRSPQTIFALTSANLHGGLQQWLKWRELAAVKSGSLYYLPADTLTRPSLRMLDAIELACEYMHINPE